MSARYSKRFLAALNAVTAKRPRTVIQHILEHGYITSQDIEQYMLLCPSANRAKSWTCEHCVNWTKKEPAFCVKCYWAHPEDYAHVAGKQQKAICVVFTGDEIQDYNRLIEIAGITEAQKTIKRLIRDFVR